MCPVRPSDSALKDIQKILGVRFADPRLLVTALTHRSLNSPHQEHNERLEFLGDAVLSLVVSHHLYRCFPKAAEGDLAKSKAALVNDSSLAALGQRLGIGKHLVMGRGEDLTGGRTRTSVLANAMEALIGAIYLDQGYAAAQSFLLDHLPFPKPGRRPTAPLDPKTNLQEILQASGAGLPRYQVISENGPDHSKSFLVQVVWANQVWGMGEASTKKQAEKLAAKQALGRLKGSNLKVSD